MGLYTELSVVHKTCVVHKTEDVEVVLRSFQKTAMTSQHASVAQHKTILFLGTEQSRQESEMMTGTKRCKMRLVPRVLLFLL